MAAAAVSPAADDYQEQTVAAVAEATAARRCQNSANHRCGLKKSIIALILVCVALAGSLVEDLYVVRSYITPLLSTELTATTRAIQLGVAQVLAEWGGNATGSTTTSSRIVLEERQPVVVRVAVPADEFWQLSPAERPLTELREVDLQEFTMRINTFKRPDFLAASVAWHSRCEGVRQIQVVWSTAQEQDNRTRVPREVLDNPKVYVERRDSNSLNDRFDILPTTPTATLGILTIDDDLLYPCEALDMGFFLWAQNPTRMVSYAVRRHSRRVNGKDGSVQWGYDKGQGRKYSIGLTATAFTHRDYLFDYTHYLPRSMLAHVHRKFNCEDIAMSLLISNLTQQQLPLATDGWAAESRVLLKTPNGYSGISSGGGHIQKRSICIDWFATHLGFKAHFEANPQFGSTGYLTTFNITKEDLQQHKSLQIIVNNTRFRNLEAKRQRWKKFKNMQKGIGMSLGNGPALFRAARKLDGKSSKSRERKMLDQEQRQR